MFLQSKVFVSRAKRGIWIWCVTAPTPPTPPWKSLGRQFSGARGGAVTQCGGLGDSFWRSEAGTVTQWALRAGISTHTGGEGGGRI